MPLNIFYYCRARLVQRSEETPKGMRRHGEFFTLQSYGLQDTEMCAIFPRASLVVTSVDFFQIIPRKDLFKIPFSSVYIK